MGTVMSSGKIKIQSNTVYMTNIAEETNVMGVVISRMWWKPWRWKVKPIYYKPQIVYDASPGEVHYTDEGETTSNLTLLGAIGMAKLWGVKHKDFEGVMK
jgi:hypothetical protein